MVISNLGSIVLSLPSAGSSATANAAQQVRLLSFFNTISRLLVGPLADVIAPVASRLESGVWGFAGKRHTSRVAFMLGICALLSVTFAWLNVGVRNQEDIWPLRYALCTHAFRVSDSHYGVPQRWHRIRLWSDVHRPVSTRYVPVSERKP